ncbi:hypothetical protein [Siminovitchia sp. 179-K 8D1 HS]|uniref:hypothetical protein n=1 Tax=Siminovitchia sp. 179-K 8D1 HS TaxID=3142385 RepID=UPI0039A33325
MTKLQLEVEKRLEDQFNVEMVKQNDSEGYTKEFKKMEYLCSLSPIERLKQYSKGIEMTPSHGLTNNEFLELCNSFNIELSYITIKWVNEKLDYIIPGGYSFRGRSYNGELKEIGEAIDAIFISEFYPQDIECETESNRFLKEMKAGQIA